MTRSKSAGHDRRERASERLEIRELIERYFAGLDRRDFTMVETCFTDDANIVHWGGEQVFVGRRELVAALPDMLEPFRSSVHSLAHLTIAEIDRDVRVHYDDLVVRIGDEWLLDVRWHAPEWEYEPGRRSNS